MVENSNGLPIDKPKYLHAKRLAKATDEQIAEAYRSGLSLAKVAERFGIHDTTAAREALTYAVEQKGKDGVVKAGAYLDRLFVHSKVRELSAKHSHHGFDDFYPSLLYAALAPASVLCDVFLMVLEDR